LALGGGGRGVSVMGFGLWDSVDVRLRH